MADTTIFDALRADHDRQRDLMARLLDTSGDTPERAETFEALQLEMEAHAGAEERAFYVRLMESDLTQDKSRHSIAEHEELDDLVEELTDLDRSSPQWLVQAKQLCDRLEHHLEEEERELFPLAGKALADDEKLTLAVDYHDDMERRRNE